MIIKFPPPFSDETFYSWVARYHDQSMNVLPKATIWQLYGESSGCAIYGMPTGIEQFCEKLLPLNIYSAEDILKHHTLLPYFSLVLPSERMQNTRVKMLQLSNAGAQGQLGTLASTVKNFRFLRFCPQCVEDDRQYMGAAYWHRVHQLPGVLVCPFHECPTFNSQVDKQHTAYQLYASAEKYAKENARQSKLVVDDKLLSIAQASAELLRSYQPHAKLETYRNQLLSLGFNHGGNAINQKMLAEGFIRYWEVERLEKLGITTNFYKESQWLRFITRKAERGSQFQPLQHILIRLFIQSLKQSDVHPGIKASSPETIYSCPNSFCDQKEKLSAKVINTHHSKKKGATYGVIECKCGFTFSANLDVEKLYTGHVIDYGAVWKKNFKANIEKGLSLPEMIESMAISRGTVLRKVKEYNLKPTWKVKLKPRDKLRTRIEARKVIERKNFLQYRKTHPNQSRSEIRTAIDPTYKFLARQDREWLNEHLPALKKAKPKKRRVDWKKRDKALLIEAKNVVSELISMTGKPKRITPSVISKILGKKNLFTKICSSKIPKTMAYLQEACHANHHHKRRLFWAKGELIRRGKTITRSNLIYTACLSNDLTPYQESLIKEILEACNEEDYFNQGRTG